MAPLTRRAFARRLLRIRAGRFRTFVAECYRARGYDIEWEGDRLHVRRGDRSETLLVHASRWNPLSSPPEDAAVDAVVTRGSTRGARRLARRLDAAVVGPTDLHAMVLYAVDRADAAALVETHLGRSLERRPGRLESASAVGVDREALAQVASVALVVALLLGTVAVTGGGGGGLVPGVASSADGPGFERPIGDGRPEATPPATIGLADTLPPGIEGLGRTDVNVYRLARAHVRVLTNDSYELTLRYRRTIDEAFLTTRWAWSTQHVRVESPYNYTYQGKGRSLYERGNDSVVLWTEYATGDRVYERYSEGNETWTDGRETYVDRYGRFAGRTQRYVLRYLTGQNATVEQRLAGGRSSYVVETDDAPEWPRFAQVTEYRAVAVVEPDGVVRYLRVEYVNANGYPARFEFRVTRLSNLSVDRPAWVGNTSGEGGDAVTPANTWGTGPGYQSEYWTGVDLTGRERTTTGPETTTDEDSTGGSHSVSLRRSPYRSQAF